MLVLSRKRDEKIVIADSIEITIIAIRGDKVRLGIVAPRDVRILRGELIDNNHEAENENDSKTGDDVASD